MAKDRFFNVRMFQDVSEGEDSPAGTGRGKELMGETETPLLDIYEEPDAIVIEADLPGVKPGQVEVRMENNSVVIEGRRGERGEGQDAGHYLRMERSFEDFRRIISLPTAVDQQRAEAYYKKGVLVLRFPRVADRRNRTIKIAIK
ncbi:MAG TPA: Hsp20/alpha crystallin family protein [Nitrospiria bacterium]|nr:Hsp20/alpha crystallin family protein [Nitrospiria bacterium]